ncbi:hypothetical protein GCM10010341_82670 [Streptomyces noursei]|nr:hypothetical protein GCM10010341_82670 [Streptomyces noursei]
MQEGAGVAVEAEGMAECVEDPGRRAALAALFEAGAVVDVHPGQHRYFFHPQPGDSADVVARHAGVFGPQSGAPGPQKVPRHAMQHIKLGGLEVSRIGLGAMGMSHGYTGAGTDEAESIRTVHRALELGVTPSTPPSSTDRTPTRNCSAGH